MVMRAPNTMRLNRSLPIRSVPSQFAASGACRRLAVWKSATSPGYGARMGANIAATISTTSSATPSAAARSRANRPNPRRQPGIIVIPAGR